MMMNRRLILARLTAAVVLLLTLMAGVGGPAHAADPVEPEALVREVLDEVMVELRGNDAIRGNNEALYEYIDSRVLPYFDFRRMSRRVLGRHWRAASDAQKDAFVAEFKALLVRTYSTAMVEYVDEEVRLLGTRERSPGKQVSVRTQLDRRSGPAVPINFEMFNGSKGWKVFDVAVDGISLVINYRGSFDREVRRSGIDGLIAKMRNGTVSAG